MATGDDHGRSSRSWIKPCACRDWRTCGCRRSATASTCSPPASRARLALKFPAPTADIDAIAGQIEVVARSVPGVTSALAERLVGGRYLNIDIHREKAARYGMTVGDVQLFVSSAIGGAMVGETVGRRALSDQHPLPAELSRQPGDPAPAADPHAAEATDCPRRRG